MPVQPAFSQTIFLILSSSYTLNHQNRVSSYYSSGVASSMSTLAWLFSISTKPEEIS